MNHNVPAVCQLRTMSSALVSCIFRPDDLWYNCQRWESGHGTATGGAMAQRRAKNRRTPDRPFRRHTPHHGERSRQHQCVHPRVQQLQRGNYVVTAAVFTVMGAIWCLLGSHATGQPAIKNRIARYQHVLIPAVPIVHGASIHLK